MRGWHLNVLIIMFTPQEVPSAASSTKPVTLQPKVPDALCLPAIEASDRSTSGTVDTAPSQFPASRWRRGTTLTSVNLIKV